MKKLIGSLFIAAALMASTSVMAQTEKKTEKAKTEACCKKGEAEKKACCKDATAKSEKKACCSAEKKAAK